jgi:carbamoyltransferase
VTIANSRARVALANAAGSGPSTAVTALGFAGARRNACAALCVDGRVLAACEQERLTRVRGVGLQPGRLPAEAVDEVLALSGTARTGVTAYVSAEQEWVAPFARSEVVDHHEAHAATAFLGSPFARAAVLVCDRHVARELSIWIGEGTSVVDQRWPWRGRAFATLYSECAELFGLNSHSRPHSLESLAHLGRNDGACEVDGLFRYVGDGMEVNRGWQTSLDQLIQSGRLRQGQAAAVASAVQRRIGQLLLECLADVRAAIDTDSLCLGGGLFYNTYFTTLVCQSGLFKNVFVPINPGNPGLAVGGALLVSSRNGGGAPRTDVSPFLGPEYDPEAVKATLDGCKLSYALVSESEALDHAVAALRRGHLVGWFQGRMEWGHRALGHRSILADPTSPYVLDNLNLFLRKRERSRAFGVSICEDDVAGLLAGPPTSRFMEYQYTPRDDRLRCVMPPGASSIRVQTVPPENEVFSALLKRMKQATGMGVLVNTSFNGFREPVVCSPRDAIRVFYGTGLDMLVMGRFMLTK